ncbi:DUF952 domain-containing protein [Ornithinimicrobium cerasi]|uniref:Uncharacterized conserved protein, DUF952 family n=1 Tax=Ornithinimicrobium cerasi TaxID=2248773 RepID=A0A285VE94_9MICO|nr:DUF952 domain-containing protein [Ornithinimicrobium cerasi]SOC52435.1 Uncharacterized conserved protein, DUF952 family [Ornithinimicrobium cerasi]
MSAREPVRSVWHLAERRHWEAALASGSYERSTLGATLQEVGFVHASFPEQLPGVVRAHYARVAEPLVVLEIDPQLLDQAGVQVRLEPGDPDDPGSERFPHLYGPVPVPAVTRTRPAAVDRGWLELGPWEATRQPRT